MLNLIDLGKDKQGKDKKAQNGQKLLNVPVESVQPNPSQPRRSFNEQALEELAHSIRQFGLLQPITVRKLGTDKYELIAGERRLRAAKLAGFTRINAIVMPAIEQESALLAIVENLQREGLNCFEEAQAYYEILRDHGLTQEELARELGKNQSTIANKIRLLRLGGEVRAFAERHAMSERHVRALLRLADERKQLEIARKVVEQSLSVKQTEALVERLVEETTSDKKRSKVRLLHRDYRLFVNTIRATVAQIKEQGVNASVSTKDLGDSVEIRVLITKKMHVDDMRGKGVL